MESNKTFLVGAVLIAGITVILADVKQPSKIDDAELEMLLSKSEEQLARVTMVAKQVDAITVERQEKMIEQIEVLEVKNEKLDIKAKQAKIAYNEMVVKYDSAPTQQFDIFAILPDSENSR